MYRITYATISFRFVISVSHADRTDSYILLYTINLVPRAFPLKMGGAGKGPGDEVDILYQVTAKGQQKVGISSPKVKVTFE